MMTFAWPMRYCLFFCLFLAACASPETRLPASASPSNPLLYVPVTASVTPSPGRASPVPPLPPTPTPIPYTIVSGDTLLAVANRHNLSLDELLAANPGIQPQALTIGQVIQIPPPSTIRLALPTPLAMTPVSSRCFASGAGTWCVVLLETPAHAALENLQGQLTLRDETGEILETSPATALLNRFPAASVAPLGVFFDRAYQPGFSVDLLLTSAVQTASADPRYIPAVLQNMLVQVNAGGQAASVAGEISLPQAAARTWLLALAYDETGQLVGLRRWESGQHPAGLFSFSFSIYSVGPAIHRVVVIPEAVR